MSEEPDHTLMVVFVTDGYRSALFGSKAFWCFVLQKLWTEYTVQNKIGGNGNQNLTYQPTLNLQHCRMPNITKALMLYMRYTLTVECHE